MIESIHLRICGFIVAAMLIGYGLFSEDGIYFRYATPPVQTMAKSHTNPATTPAAPVYELTKTRIADIKVGTRVPAFDPGLGSEVRAKFAEPNWAQWIKLNLEMTKSDGSLLKMEMLRHEDWVLENIDYEFLDDEDLKATSLLTAANSSQFIKSFPLEAPQVPLRTLFAELHDVRLLMAEVEADSVLVTISLDLPEIGVRGDAVVTGVEPCPAILSGPGKVVLTTFHHASSHLIDLYLSPQPPAHLQQIQGAQQILDHDRWGQDSRASSPELAPRPIPAREADAAFDPVRRTGSTNAQTSEEALLYPQVSRSSVVDQSWERIGVTGNHPIWSDDRHDYIAAMDLRVGERLKNLSGDIVWVQQKLPRPGPTPVYNLEVQDEHVYYVGASRVLAHNVGVVNSSANCRPSARQSEMDVNQLNPNHRTQVSFVNGNEVSYGTRGSVRPDNFSSGDSIEVKNYDVLQPSNRANLYNTIHKQYLQRQSNLPRGTRQRVVIDVRGQNVHDSILMRMRRNILTITHSSNVDVEFLR